MEPHALLRRARASARLSQEELARRARTSQSAVNRYERGTAVPTLATLERLLAACGRELTLTSRPLKGSAAIARVREHADALRRAAARRGARNIRIFGSVSRGEADPGSDVDLLVDLDPDRSLLDLAGFAEDAAEILGRSVDVATPKMLKEQIKGEVFAQAVPL